MRLRFEYKIVRLFGVAQAILGLEGLVMVEERSTFWRAREARRSGLIGFFSLSVEISTLANTRKSKQNRFPYKSRLLWRMLSVYVESGAHNEV